MAFNVQAESPPLREDARGALRVGDSRVLLELVIQAFQDGATPETIVQRYSTLALSDVYAVIAYYLRHQDEVEAYLARRQRQSEEINVEGGRLIRARDLARETLVTLARKVDEVRIAAQEKNGILRIGSYASVPQHPVGPRRLFNSVVAALLALIVGVVGAFSVEFWRGRSRTTDGQE